MRVRISRSSAPGSAGDELQREWQRWRKNSRQGDGQTPKQINENLKHFKQDYRKLKDHNSGSGPDRGTGPA